MRPTRAPRIGDVVHVQRPGNKVTDPLPAIIVRVLPPPYDEDGMVVLCVVDEVRGVHFEAVRHCDVYEPGRWSYPSIAEEPSVIGKVKRGFTDGMDQCPDCFALYQVRDGHHCPG